MTATVWLIIAVLGQAAALLLVQAGPVVTYQHYSFDLDLWNGYSPLFFGVILLQAGLVVILGRHQIGRLVAWARSRLQPWRWVIISLVLLATSAAPSRSPLVYAWESVFSFAVQMLCLATILLWAASSTGTTRRRAIDAFTWILGAERSKDSGVDGLTVVGAIWVTVLAAFLGHASYEWHPHLADEVAYMLQSRYMALGWLSAPILPVQDAFTPEMVLVDADRWFSIFPPGWPGLLALGQRLGSPWLVNPLLAGFSVILVRLLVGETHGRGTARLVVVLLCTSPWFIFLSMSFMAHTASLACALLGAWAVARARRGVPAWALLAGAAIGGLSLVRPLEGVVGGAVLGLWMVWPAAKRPWL